MDDDEGFFPMKELEPLGSWREECVCKELSRTSEIPPRTIRSWPHLQPLSLPVTHMALQAPVPSKSMGFCHPEAAASFFCPRTGMPASDTETAIHQRCKTFLDLLLLSSPHSLHECLRIPLPCRAVLSDRASALSVRSEITEVGRGWGGCALHTYFRASFIHLVNQQI